MLARRDPDRRGVLAAAQEAPQLGPEAGRDLVGVCHRLILPQRGLRLNGAAERGEIRSWFR